MWTRCVLIAKKDMRRVYSKQDANVQCDFIFSQLCFWKCALWHERRLHCCHVILTVKNLGSLDCCHVVYIWTDTKILHNERGGAKSFIIDCTLMLPCAKWFDMVDCQWVKCLHKRGLTVQKDCIRHIITYVFLLGTLKIDSFKYYFSRACSSPSQCAPCSYGTCSSCTADSSCGWYNTRTNFITHSIPLPELMDGKIRLRSYTFQSHSKGAVSSVTPRTDLYALS